MTDNVDIVRVAAEGKACLQASVPMGASISTDADADSLPRQVRREYLAWCRRWRDRQEQLLGHQHLLFSKFEDAGLSVFAFFKELQLEETYEDEDEDDLDVDVKDEEHSSSNDPMEETQSNETSNSGRDEYGINPRRKRRRLDPAAAEERKQERAARAAADRAMRLRDKKNQSRNL